MERRLLLSGTSGSCVNYEYCLIFMMSNITALAKWHHLFI